MQREELTASFEQLSWQFLDMSLDSGRLALVWERTMASAAFGIGESESGP